MQEQQELHQQTQQRQQLALAAAHVAVEQQGVSCLCASCAASSQAAEAASPDSEAKSPVASSAPLCGWKQTLPQLLFLIGSCCGSCPRVCSSLQVLVAKLVMLHRPSTALLCAVSGGARAFSAWRQQQAVQTPSAAAAASSGTAGGVWWSDAPPPLLSPEDLLYERLLAAACTGESAVKEGKVSTSSVACFYGAKPSVALAPIFRLFVFRTCFTPNPQKSPAAFERRPAAVRVPGSAGGKIGE